MSRSAHFPLRLVFAGLSLAALALVLPAGHSAAGNTWSTATVINTPLVDATFTVAPSEEMWYVLHPTFGDAFTYNITTDGMVDVGFFWADTSGQPNLSYIPFTMEPPSFTQYNYSWPFANTTDRFAMFRGNVSGSGANVTLSMGAYTLFRAQPGNNLTFHFNSSNFQNNPPTFTFALDNELLGGTDGLWTLNLSFDFDNSSQTPAKLNIQAFCVGLPYCAPEGLPANYSRGVLARPGAQSDGVQLASGFLTGAGSSLSLAISESSQGLTYVRVTGGYFTTVPAGTTLDITCTLNISRAALPARNADDHRQNATNVTSHASHAGNFSLDGNTVDWYTFVMPSTALQFTATLSGTGYTLFGVPGTGLAIAIEAILYDGAGRPLAANHTEIDPQSFGCFGCTAGASNMAFQTPAGFAAGQTVYLSLHVLSVPWEHFDALLSYTLVIDLPNRVPTPTTASVNLTINEDASHLLDLGALFVDGDGDIMTFASGVIASTVPVALLHGGTLLNISPSRDAFGTAFIRVTGGDAYSGQVGELFVNLTVISVNDAPLSDGVRRYLLWDQGQPSGALNVLAAFSDVDGDVLSYSVQLPAAFTSTSCGAGCFIIHLPDNETYGNFSATIFATDPGGMGASVPLELVIDHVNRSPLVTAATPASPFSFSHTGEVTLAATVGDPDGDTLILTWQLDGVGVTGTGASLVMSGLSTGNHSARLTVSDGVVSVYAFWLLVVTNEAPMLEPDPLGPSVSLSHGASATFSVIATDPDGDALTFSWAIDGRAVVGYGTSVTLDRPRVGHHDVHLEVSDGTDFATFSWSVESTDTAPTLVPTPADADVSSSHRSSFEFSVLAGDIDNDPVSFEWLVDGVPVAGTNLSTFIASGLAVGPHSVEVRVKANLRQVKHAWSVVSTNAFPSIAALEPPEGQVTIDRGEATVFRVTGADLDDDPLEYAWFLDDVHTGQMGATYTPRATIAVGSHTLRAIVRDTEGKEASAQWTLTVEAPAAEPPSQPPSTPGLEAMWALAAFAAAAGAISASTTRRRRS